MNLLLWVTVSFIIIGFVVNIVIKRNVERKKIPSTQAIVWWIVGTTVWGIVSIILIVWCFSKV